MAVRAIKKWPTTLAAAALLSLPWLAPEPVGADANGGIAAAIGLTAADGSVRTQAGVRLSIAPLPGAPDRVVAMSGAIKARMPAVRACFAAAMARAPASEGMAEFAVEAAARGAAKVRVLRDETGDPKLVSCMSRALARATFGEVPRGSRALTGIYLSNPLAAMRRQLAERPPTRGVRMLSGGRAESAGGTDDIKFRVSGSAYAAVTIASVADDMSTRVAGLLDCRRKAFRREREANGSIELGLTLRKGELAHTAPRGTAKASASRCVAKWLTALDASRLADADLELAVSFATSRPSTSKR